MKVKEYQRPYQEPITFETLMWNDFFILADDIDKDRTLFKVISPAKDLNGQTTVRNAVKIYNKNNNENALYTFPPKELVYRVYIEEIVIQIER